MYEYRYHDEIGKIITNLINLKKNDEVNFLKEEFLKKVYASFFIVSKKGKQVKSKDFICNAIHKICGEKINKDLIFDISKELIENDASLFSLLETPYNMYDIFLLHQDKDINEIGKHFNNKEFSYICVISKQDELIIFTSIDEEKLQPTLEELGLEIIPLHSIIPTIINNISGDIISGKISLSELGISFPLSILGSHSYISGKFKRSNTIHNDTNFRNLIKYGLLDQIKLKKKYTIGFSKTSEKNKFRLYGNIYKGTDNENGTSIKEQLDNFLLDLGTFGTQEEFSNQYFNLPLYIIYKKESFDTKYPYFYIDQQTGEIYLKMPDGNQYLLTGIYPRYFKTCTKGDSYYLGLKEGIQKDELSIAFNDIFNNKNYDNLKNTFDKILNAIKIKYHYHNINVTSKNSTEFRPVDLLFSFTNSKDNTDFLFNFTSFKNDGKKITLEIYKLNGKVFSLKNVEQNIKQKYFYDNSNLIYSKFDILENDSISYNLCFPDEKKILHVKTTTKKIEVGKKYKYILGGKIFERINAKNYINDSQFTYEDSLSLCLIDILNNKKNTTAFYGGKGKDNNRELADIISIETFETSYTINLYHIKKNPFFYTKTKSLEGSFSLYTEVVGQLLQKIRGILYENNIDNIGEGLSLYFQKTNPIYMAIIDVINHSKINNKKINFNIYFNARYDDYFLNNNEELMTLPNNKLLSLETNWKTLYTINDIFNANVNSVTIPGLNIGLNLNILISKKSDNINTKNATNYIIDLHSIKIDDFFKSEID